MVYKCAVPCCKTGYNSCSAEEKVSVYKFPKDGEYLNMWIKAIHRKKSDGRDWTAEDVKDHHRVCSLHFVEDDFVSESQDQREGRKNLQPTKHLVRRRLKSTAVPRIFSGQPSYLSIAPSKTRPTSSTVDSCLQLENKRISVLNESVIDLDTVSDLSQLIQKLKSEITPSDNILIQRENNLLFLYVPNIDDIGSAQKIQFFVRLSNDLKISVYKDTVEIKSDIYNHLLSNDNGCDKPRISSVVSLLNILAFVKTTVDELYKDENSSLKVAASAIEKLGKPQHE